MTDRLPRSIAYPRIAIAAVLTWLLIFAAAKAVFADEAYVQAGLGCLLPTATSNADGVEFNGDLMDCGIAGQVEGGYVTPLTPQLDLELGAALQGMGIDLHGQNGAGKQTADGERLDLVAGLGVARLTYGVWRDLSLHAGGGLGSALVYGLDDSDLAPAMRLEAGARYAITENLSAGLGYQALTIFGASLDGNSLDSWFHGPVGSLRWQFNYGE